MGTKEETMNIIHIHQKGKHLNTLEKFHIYTEALTNNHLNDQHTVNFNKIFEVIHNNDTITGDNTKPSLTIPPPPLP